MPNIKISDLSNVTPSGYTPDDLLVIVNYNGNPTGVTRNTKISDITNYVLSGLTFTFTGGTINGLTANTISTSTLIVNGVQITGDTYVTSFDYDNANTINIYQNNGQNTGITLNTFTGLTINGGLSSTTLSSTTITLTTGAMPGYVLTSNGLGNATWQPPSGGFAGFINITYDDLYTKVINNDLTPNAWYRLTDYRSVNYLNGWQTKFNNPPTYGITGFSPSQLYTGSTEVLLLYALSGNTISPIGFSETYLGDIVEYNPLGNPYNLIPIPSGWITRRIDTKRNIDVPFDFRGRKYRRFRVELFGNITTFTYSSTITGTTTASYSDVYGTSSSTGVTEASFDISIVSGVGITSLVLRKFGKNYKVNDTITIPGSSVGEPQNITITVTGIYSNIDFWSIGVKLGNQISNGNYQDFNVFNDYSGSYNIKWRDVGDIFSTNISNFGLNDNVVFKGEVVDCIIGGQFRSNTIGPTFVKNKIGDVFEYNFIGTSFYENTISGRFTNNSIGNLNAKNVINYNFEFNSTNNLFFNNKVDYGFGGNFIGFGFSNNSIGIGFSSNSVKTNFNSNNTSQTFQDNNIGSNFTQNFIGSYFNNNKIGNDFTYNNTNMGTISGLNFLSATHVYNLYNCTISKGSSLDYWLTYINNSGSLIVTGATT